MAAKSKYKKKYAKELREGLRKDGKSIDEVCLHWHVSESAYQGWRKAHPEFEEAHKMGEMDKKAWWRGQQRKAAAAGNAAVINFALKNECDYVDKQEVEHKHNEQITTIRIERLPGRVIEHERTPDLLDQQPS